MRLLVIGGGRGLDQIIDALPQPSIIVGVMDDRELETEKYWGKINASEAKRRSELDQYDLAIISISTSIEVRKKIYIEFTTMGIIFANIIHKTTHHARISGFGYGNVILANCHIGTHTKIGNNNFISAGCSIEHHNEVGSHCTFGPYVVTSSRCKIGHRVKFGTGIFMEPGVEIGDDCIIGSGTILTMNTKVPPKHIIRTKIHSVPQELK